MATKKKAPAKKGGWIFPVRAPIKILDDFEAHIARGSVNPGLDFPKAVGAPIMACQAGTVTIANSVGAGAGGKMVVLDHGAGFTSEYLHMSKLNVSNGTKVAAGDVIGFVGGSGFGQPDHYGAHLHLAIKQRGKNVDPYAFLKEH
jgi:murein DD-endopeptidase MepM/ murein hydrolase activator NlpD